MLYYLFEYLEQEFQLPGASLFQFISFRASIAIIFSLLVSLIFGKQIIELLQRSQMGESIRDCSGKAVFLARLLRRSHHHSCHLFGIVIKFDNIYISSHHHDHLDGRHRIYR